LPLPYLGFVALLRTSEIVGLKFDHICWLHNQSEAALVLQTSKLGTRLGITEQMVAGDTGVLKAVRLAHLGRRSSDTLFSFAGQRFAEELKRLGSHAGLSLDTLTPYSLRRGGATHNFQQHFQISKSAALGRWSSEKAARIYIDQAIAHQVEGSISGRSRRILVKASKFAAEVLELDIVVAKRQLSRQK